jgi:hypothetical protein
MGVLMKPSQPLINIKNIPTLQRGYWSRPAAKAKGDATVDPVYRAVGRALSQWEMLEQNLANLFLVVCECPNHSANPVRRAFGAIENGTLRRAAIREAAMCHFGQHWDIPAVQKSFGALIEAVSFASKRRDDIAHGIVQQIGLDRIDYGAFLFPQYYNSARTKPYIVVGDGPPTPPDFRFMDYRFTSSDILEFEKRFGDLKQVVVQFANLSGRGKADKIPFVAAVTGEPP